MKKTAVIFLLLLVLGCSGPMGAVRVEKSLYDNSTEIVMKPGWACRNVRTSDCSILLGLSRTSRMKDNEVIITAGVVGITNLAEGKALHFNIDGETVDLFTGDPSTSFDVSDSGENWSSKKFTASGPLIKRLISAKRVIVKIDYSDGLYAEGVFSQDGANMARPGFKKFYHQAFEKSM